MRKFKLHPSQALICLFILFVSCQKEPKPIAEVQDDSILKVYAGSITGHKDGPALEAQFNDPVFIASGPDKTLFIVEGDSYFHGRIVGPGHRIRKITPDGMVSTFFDAKTSSQGVKGINGIAIEKNGNVLISDGHYIKRISSDGTLVTTIAGDGTNQMMKDGSALKATFFNPSGLVIDKNGCVYIMDTGNNAVRMLSNGKISTLAGGDRNFNPEYTDTEPVVYGPAPKDGTGSQAQFDNPQFITIDFSGNLYVSGGWAPRIRKITQKGVVTTVRGGGNDESDFVKTVRGLTIYKDQLYYNNTDARYFRAYYTFSLNSLSLSTNQTTELVLQKWNTDDEGHSGHPLVTSDGLNYPTGMVVVENTLYICNSGENKIRKYDLN